MGRLVIKIVSREIKMRLKRLSYLGLCQQADILDNDTVWDMLGKLNESLVFRAKLDRDIKLLLMCQY